MIMRAITPWPTLLGAALMLLAAAPPTSALVTGSIYGPGTSAIPVAVVPLLDRGGTPAGERFARVLARDLVLSGYFELVDAARFPERPPSLQPGLEGTDLVAWQAAGAHLVVKGQAAAAGSRLTIEVHALDVGGRREIAGVSRRFDGHVRDVPRMAHRVADALLEFVTGTAGPFDSQIVFTRRAAGPLKDLYRLTFDGDAPTRLTREPSLALAPRWHPSGRRVLFTSYRDHRPSLFEFDLPSRRIRRLVGGRSAVLGGAWSPDGSWLLVSREEGGNSDIYLVDRSGRPQRRLTTHWSVDVSPAWAPDGRRFAFCSSRGGSPQIYVMGIDGTGLQRISRSGTYNTSPAWSPTGTHVAYTSRVGGSEIVVADASGGGARVVTSGGSNEDPAWAPDGRYLVYSTRGAGGRRLALTDLDGRVRHELTVGPGDDTSPAWISRVEE